MVQSNVGVAGGPLGLLLSSVGLKAIMAVTGAALVGFLIMHLLGNLLIFAGPDAINAYSAVLHANPALLWVARLGLLGAVGAHIAAAARLTATNIAARNGRYVVRHTPATNYAARTMEVSGPIVLLFIGYHLMHLTFGVTPGDFEHSSTDVYANLVRGFSVPLVAGFYAVANMCLGLHLFHGLYSMFQTLGINHPSYNLYFKVGALLITGFITAGNILIPLAVLGGAVS